MVTMRVSPDYSQIIIHDRDTDVFPEWKEDGYVSVSDGAISIRTQDPHVGPVGIEIFREWEMFSPREDFTLVFEGVIKVKSSILVVGSIISDDVVHLKTRNNDVQIKISVNNVDQVDHIIVDINDG